MIIATRNSSLKVLFHILVQSLLVNSENIVAAENAIATSNEVFIVSIVISAAVFLVLCSVVLFLCGDCYNSEVSSSSHPACGGNKWGGSDGYHVTSLHDVMQSSHTFGEVVNPNSQGLPYAMIPSQIQTEHQFVGYQSEPGANPGSYSGGGEPQVNRYDGGGPQSIGGSQRVGQQGMHVNPLEDMSEEPPPSYNEALRTGR